METCKAAVITGFNDPTELRDVQMPDLEPTGMLVEVEAATLCGTDVHIWHDAANPKMLPYIPGHETAGRIVAINGERFDVHGNALKEGDRIVSAYRFCGHCFYCSVANQPSLCDDSIRFGRGRADQPPYLLGGCAEYHYIPPGTAIIPIPDEVTSPQAASAACALRTVMHGFERLGPIYPHDTVVVQGSGPVGLYASAVARDRGAGRVLVIGAPRVRLDVAEAWGADETLDIGDVPDAKDRHEWVMERTGGRGADVAIQCVSFAVIPEGLGFLRPGGRYLSIGGGGGPVSINGFGQQVTIVSVRSGEGRHYHQALEFLRTRGGSVPFARMLSRPYSLNETSDALHAMADFREVKTVILPHGNQGRN